MSKTPKYLKGPHSKSAKTLVKMKKSKVPNDALSESQFETADTLLNMQSNKTAKRSLASPKTTS